MFVASTLSPRLGEALKPDDTALPEHPGTRGHGSRRDWPSCHPTRSPRHVFQETRNCQRDCCVAWRRQTAAPASPKSRDQSPPAATGKGAACAPVGLVSLESRFCTSLGVSHAVILARGLLRAAQGPPGGASKALRSGASSRRDFPPTMPAAPPSLPRSLSTRRFPLAVRPECPR